MAFVEWLSSLIGIVEPILAKGRCDTEESEAVSLNMKIMCLAAGVGLSVWTSIDWFLGLVFNSLFIPQLHGWIWASHPTSGDGDSPKKKRLV